MKLELRAAIKYSDTGYAIIMFYRENFPIGSAGNSGNLLLKVNEAHDFALKTPWMKWYTFGNDEIPYGKVKEYLESEREKIKNRITIKPIQRPKIELDLDKLEINI